jgi:hypothetical protein
MPNKPKMNVFTDQKGSQGKSQTKAEASRDVFSKKTISDRSSDSANESKRKKSDKKNRGPLNQDQDQDKKRYQESKAVAELFLTVPLKPNVRRSLEKLAQKSGLEPHRCVELAVQGLVWTGPLAAIALDRGVRWADRFQKKSASFFNFVESQLKETQRKRS